MPSKSKAQRRLFEIAAKDPTFAKKVGIDMKTAKEWHEADKKAKKAGKQKRLPKRIAKEDRPAFLDW